MSYSVLLSLLRDPNCLVVCNHSGGKDSQAMYLRIRNLVPKNRLVVIHAHLPEVEWEGTEEFIRATIDHELFVCQARKTFFEMVEHRKQFPSPTNRQCTSDLKRNPIVKAIRQICNDRGFNKVLNCMGLRAQESSGRAKKKVFRVNENESNSKRTFYEWLPIHKMTTDGVFSLIKSKGQQPFWVYAAGMSRKSCVFCIMASESDHCVAASLRPALLDKYDYYEKKFDRTMLMPQKGGKRQFLKDLIASKNNNSSNN